MLSAFTRVQILAFVFIVHWIIETSGESAFRWVLRSYVIATLGVIAMTYITGAAIRSIEEEGSRYAASLGQTLDANLLSVIIGLAFLTAVYLMVSDSNFLFRIIYLIAIVFLPVMMVRTGSRGGLIAMFVTLTSPLLFLKQVLRKPALAVILLLVIMMGSAAIWVLATYSTMATQLTERLTDFEKIQSGFNYRLELVSDAVKSVMANPMGTTLHGWLVSHIHVPHSDFFYALAIYGIPGAALFACFMIMMIFTVKRIPFGFEKFYSRAIVTFLLVSGLSLGQLGQKHYWVFLTIAMACERMAWLKSQAPEYVGDQIAEETAGLDY
jgi:hypothetical protein